MALLYYFLGMGLGRKSIVRTCGRTWVRKYGQTRESQFFFDGVPLAQYCAYGVQELCY